MRYRRTVSATLLPAMLLHIAACTKTVWVSPEDIRPQDENVRAIITAAVDTVHFDSDPSWGRVQNDSLFGYVDQQTFQIDLQQISAARVKRTDVLKTISLVYLTIGAVLITVGIAMGGAFTYP